MINLEIPKRYAGLVDQAQGVAAQMFRPISRKYDRAEHEYPVELDTLGALLDGMNAGGEGAGVSKLSNKDAPDDGSVKNGRNLSAVLGMIELCWGDVGLALLLLRSLHALVRTPHAAKCGQREYGEGTMKG